MKPRRIHILLLILILAVCTVPFRARIRTAAISAIQTVKGRKTVDERVMEFRAAVHERLGKRFIAAGVAYPPRKIILAGLKLEQELEVWVSADGTAFRYLKTYPILAASGTLGPKLAEGDGQVPEGVYGVESLNPNSLYHLALRLNYPNDFDKAKGVLDGRSKLGSDIMIHGKAASIGCLAMGDEAAEDLFVMAAETGIENISVILSPIDFRRGKLTPALPEVPPWVRELYPILKKELGKLQK